MIRRLIRYTLAISILLLTVYTIGQIHIGTPTAGPLAAVCGVLLLLLARAMTIAQRPRG